ncbi:MAG: DNA-binding response regulator [Solirubrobacterales bacterium]|nr:DNA-binding response regulator [Solirubrobacterales bacterium]
MRILIVDDNPSVRALARVYAEQEAACEVAEAGDGAEALRLAREESFDLVIVDFHMPGLDGLETTRALLELAPGTAVVAWTSVLDPAVEQAFVEAGALCHVPKTDTERLRRVIRERSRATMANPACRVA